MVHVQTHPGCGSGCGCGEPCRGPAMHTLPGVSNQLIVYYLIMCVLGYSFCHTRPTTWLQVTSNEKILSFC